MLRVKGKRKKRILILFKADTLLQIFKEIENWTLGGYDLIFMFSSMENENVLFIGEMKPQ